ncbi:putative ariadne ring [Diplodia seriata]|uniref:Putative ariadne ring n=1 Tax=Diplodia seriata TaxID=420778 RepID=A0A0G2F132_9PEZI|nr:putative ariadne ring [Diplodia seriata]
MDGQTLAAIQTQLVDVDASSKRLQLSAVSCSWYKPSRVAWLHFEKVDQALAAANVLGKRRVRQRKLQAAYQKPPEHAYRGGHRIVHSVQLGNLHVDTTSQDVIQSLSGSCKPKTIKWGPASYTTPAATVERTMRLRLEEFGPLSDWETTIDDSSNVRTRATARFVNADDARTAASRLHERRIPEVGNTKIHVSAITSVKLSVQVAVLRAVRADMDELKAQVWEAHHVRIKAYEAATAHAPHTTLRIYGDDRKAVAQAKGSVERMLAGTVASTDDVDGDGGSNAITDAFFFQPAGAAFLQSLMDEHSVFVCRDTKKSLLRLYGPPAAVKSAEAALRIRRRRPDLSGTTTAATTGTITLTPHTLGLGLRGGFKRLVEAFGKDAVKIDIASTPKTVTIQGREQQQQHFNDVKRATAILTSVEPSPTSHGDDDDNDLCAVCWTTPEDAVRRQRCGHAYCRDCLAGQCGSADVPIRCLGGGGACNEAMTLPELADALRPAAAFDALLQRALTAHVRARPGVFQFCPTPDCDRVYRCSVDGRTVLCDECLADVCTACHVAAHDDLSCAEARELGSEGERAFRKWSKENDARACPRCGTMIVKSYGCNHMQCKPGCGIHICWFCMKVFPSSGETYAHMGQTH